MASQSVPSGADLHPRVSRLPTHRLWYHRSVPTVGSPARTCPRAACTPATWYRRASHLCSCSHSDPTEWYRRSVPTVAAQTCMARLLHTTNTAIARASRTCRPAPVCKTRANSQTMVSPERPICAVVPIPSRRMVSPNRPKVDNRAAGARTRQRENSKRAHFRVPAFKKTHQNSTKGPPRERRKKEICGGRGKKKARNFGRSDGGRSGAGAVQRRGSGWGVVRGRVVRVGGGPVVGP